MIPTKDQVRHVAKLARLHLSDEEVIIYQEQLAGIFGYIEKLQEVDITSVSNAKHASKEQMTLRKDEVNIMNEPEKLIGVSKQEVIAGHIAIPAVIKKK